MGQIGKLPLFVLLLSILSIALIQNINGEISPSHEIPEDETFYVQHTFWAFGGFHPICVFEASSGDYIELSISSVNSDPDRPDDKYIIALTMTSTNHSTTNIRGTQFRQTIRLNYSDTYNITASKHPFYSSVTISGIVTIHHHSIPFATNASSPFAVPSLSPNSTIPTSNLNDQNSSPSPSIPEFSWMMIVPLFLSLFSIIVIIRHRRNTIL